MLFDMFQDYTLEGEFGTATDDFSHTGKVVERSTYGRIPFSSDVSSVYSLDIIVLDQCILEAI